MLVEEARWFYSQLARMAAERLSPMLNVGSQTLHFRRFVQPWIERYIFEPLQQRGVKVVHTDIRAGAGVDIVGDLMDAEFIERLRLYRFQSVFCSNLLEHVPQPKLLAERLVSILPLGGLLFVSCPRAFPYHPDPIDTGLRPDVEQLANLFPETRLVVGEIVDCGPLWHYIVARLRSRTPMYDEMSSARNGLTGSPVQAFASVQSLDHTAGSDRYAGRATGAATPVGEAEVQRTGDRPWQRALRLLAWLCRPVSATCAILETVPVWRRNSPGDRPCVS